ncbi:MAG: STAS domain-containing protein [Lachnospiraceae bacterium]|nr:STAS domain-containing protein [Lachnospiraceae bacterium]MCR5025060.1 STAS domain-containing protein [Lachnospiraceae bacterium]
MTIEEFEEENYLRLSVDGKIDANSCQEFTNAILSALQRTNSLIIDMENVTYLSSAGLRTFILGQKTAQSKGSVFSLINVQDPVMGIFHTTGFDKILKIS